MHSDFCIVELATQLAEIAGDAQDRGTAARLLALIDRLLTAAGLPP